MGSDPLNGQELVTNGTFVYRVSYLTKIHDGVALNLTGRTDRYVEREGFTGLMTWRMASISDVPIPVTRRRSSEYVNMPLPLSR